MFSPTREHGGYLSNQRRKRTAHAGAARNGYTPGVFSTRIRVLVIIACLAYGGYQLSIGDRSGGWLLLAAGIFAIGHFRTRSSRERQPE